MTTRLIRPFPRVNDPKDIEKWYNELRRAVLDIASNTDSLPEGTTNLYFTNERVDDRAAALIQAGNVITWVYDDTAGTLTPTVGVDTTAGLGVSGGNIVVVLAANKGITFDANGDLQVKDGDGIKVGSAGVEADLAANKGLEISSGAIAVKDGDGIKTGAAGVEVDYNSTNLKITAGALNTIQDIATTSSPTFVTVTGTTSCVGGTGGNDTTISGTGVKQNGTARTWNDFNFPALILAVGPSAPTTGPVGPSGSILGRTFDGTVTTDEASGGDEIKHEYAEGTTIKIHVHWSPTTNDAGNVKWLVDFMWTNVNDVDAAPTTVSAVQAAAGTAWTHQLLSISDVLGTGKKIGSHFQFRIYRNPTDAADTYAHPAQLRSVGIHFEQDTLGSRQVESKT